MEIKDERTVSRRRRRQKDAGEDFLDEHFEDPEHSDILIEKQVKEKKRKE
jgi:hypothetical protein